MPINFEFSTLIIIAMISSVLAYRLSFLHQKKIGYISLIQIYYLVLLPGFVYTLIFSEIVDILKRPLNPNNLISDKTLIVLLMVSLLYTYGGLAIHSVTKTLSRYFSPFLKKTTVYQVNEYFHLSFSHNLIYGGAILSFVFFALLDLNHVSPYGPEQGMFIGIVRGVFAALATVVGLSFYENNSWLELKFFYLSLWIGLVLVMFAAKPYYKDLDQYPVVLTLLVSLVVIAILNLFTFAKKAPKYAKIVFKLPKHIRTLLDL